VVLAVCQCVRECAMSEREEVLNVCMHVCCAAAAASCAFFFFSTTEREGESCMCCTDGEREVVLLLMCVRTQHEDGERRNI